MMRRLAAPGFFGWNHRDEPEDADKSSGPPSPCDDVRPGLDPAARLVELLLQPGAAPLLRPLRGTAELLSDALLRRAAPGPVAAQLCVAADFLAVCGAPESQLEFALCVHSDQAAAQRVACGVEDALGALCLVEGAGRAPSLKGAVALWHDGWEALTASCREAFELHFYFAFLDVKGDRALLELAAMQLGAVLQCSARGLVGGLRRTGPWVEDALRELAAGGHSELLGRRHGAALRLWRSSWQARIEQQVPEQHRQRFSAAAVPQHGEQFWDSYFSNLSKISWTDFVEALEDYYLLGRSPLDLLSQLRLLVDPRKEHIIQRSDWTRLAHRHGRIVDLVDALLGEVLLDVGLHIYRPQPLQSRHRPPQQALSGRFADMLARGPQSSASQARGQLQEDTPPSPSWLPTSMATNPKARMQQAPAAFEDTSPTATMMQGEGGHHATPQEPRRRGLPDNKQMGWDEFVGRLCANNCPWWYEPGFAPPPCASSEEPLQAAALRAVCSGVAYTRRSLILRVVSGELAQNRPVLAPTRPPASEVKVPLLPSVVVNANGTRVNGVTKFGRGSSRRVLLPDMAMSEPIASRSHFNVVYDEDSDRYSLMDAGSKWGTFVKMTRRTALSCGDWVRVGNAEFIIRHCGGGCSRRRCAHTRPHSLCALQDKLPRSAAQMWNSMTSDLEDKTGPSEPGSPNSEAALDAEHEGSDGERRRLQDELVPLVGSVRPRAWISTSVRLCHQAAVSGTSAPTGGSAQGCGSPRRLQPTLLPVAPLELDFISGPRMGERLLLTERVCTIGRGEGSTIQISDPMLANVSRTHCILEYNANRWHIRDNASTNGTWLRLSCVLCPSPLMPLVGGESILAGVHEFFVEEAEMDNWWLPSTASAVLEELCERERADLRAARQTNGDSMPRWL